MGVDVEQHLNFLVCGNFLCVLRIQLEPLRESSERLPKPVGVEFLLESQGVLQSFHRLGGAPCVRLESLYAIAQSRVVLGAPSQVEELAGIGRAKRLPVSKNGHEVRMEWNRDG